MNRLTGWLSDDKRYGRAYRLDKVTGKVVTRTGSFDGPLAGLVRRSCGRMFAIYTSNEAGVGRVIVLQQGKRRLVLDRPAADYEATVRVRVGVLRQLAIRCNGKQEFAVAGLYPWLVIGPVIDWTWDGLDELGEDFLGTAAEIVSQPENRSNALEAWPDS